jgi:hypothetical protein
LSYKCSRCGTLLPNGWVGACPKCGSIDFISYLGQAYGNVFAKIIGPENSGSLVVAANAVSTMSGAYYTAKMHLGTLRAIGTPEEYLKPLEDDINRLNEDKLEVEKKVNTMPNWSSRELDKFAENLVRKLDKDLSAIRKDVQIVGMKVDGTADLIKKLSQKVATKGDVEEAKELVLQNREIFIERLNRSKDELKKTLDKLIEGKVKKEEKNALWDILEKLSIMGGAVQFAEYVKKLIDFLNEKKILQIVLPILIKIIFG